MVTRREIRIPADMFNITPARPKYKPPDAIFKLHEDLRTYHNLDRLRLERAYDRQNTNYDRSCRSTTYQIGDLVRKHRPVPPPGVP